MLLVNTKGTFLLNLHQNRVHFPAERNAFVLDPQRGRCDVTCKPAIQVPCRVNETVIVPFVSVACYRCSDNRERCRE